MNILVTGSSGHLGEALVRVLKQKGKKVKGIDLLPSPFTDLEGSISDPAFVQQAMQGITHVLHTATLHKPHVISHSRQLFIDTNITGTLNLLEAALEAGVQSFVYTSTTSTFGDALTPAPGAPAAWITEETVPIPKNIYGVTKTTAEDLCQLFYRNHQLPCLILKTSRFFPEQDDDPRIAENYPDANAKANEYLYRRVDIEDVVSAHLLAMEKAPAIGYGRYIISATTPFQREDLPLLAKDAPAVVHRLFPGYDQLYAASGWKMFPAIGRVYVNQKARTELGWKPEYDFRYIVEKLKTGNDFRSPLTLEIGAKGYHRPVREFHQ